jgi:TolA-binding protein
MKPCSALERGNLWRAAAEAYLQAIGRGAEDRGRLRQRVFTILRDRLAAESHELDAVIDAQLGDEPDARLDHRLWALEQKLHRLEIEDRLAEGADLLAADAARFAGSDLQEHFRYLEAWVQHKLGQAEEAERSLRELRNQLETWEDVHARSGWLLGRILLDVEGPTRAEEAGSFFRDVITHHPGHPYAVASFVGLGEAEALLDRHADAVDAFVEAIEELMDGEVTEPIDRTALRTSLAVLSESQRRLGRYDWAVKYARLALPLVEAGNTEQETVQLLQLAQALSERAEQRMRASIAGDSAAHEPKPSPDPEILSLYAEAAEAYLRLAKLNIHNESRSSEASWRAAELFAKSGRLDQSIRMFEEFAHERPSDPLVPRALFMGGQLRQRMGRFAEAVEAYQQCYRRFPRTLEAAHCLVPMAQCYVALGPGSFDLAEKTLRIVLDESVVFTPDAPEFAEALFLLADLHGRKAAFEQAIATAQEAIDRYPHDPRTWSARFLVADSYRKSGLAMRQAAQDAPGDELERIRKESVGRLRRARQIYRLMMDDLELLGPVESSAPEFRYARLCRQYEADCLFETGDYAEALRAYEEWAAQSHDRTEALSAYVQIIRCQMALGRPDDARAALARARVLVDALPEAAFARGPGLRNRSEWKRFMDWLAESELF